MEREVELPERPPDEDLVRLKLRIMECEMEMELSFFGDNVSNSRPEDDDLLLSSVEEENSLLPLPR